MASIFRQCEACLQARPTHLFEVGSFQCRDCIAIGREVPPAPLTISPRTYVYPAPCTYLTPGTLITRSPSAGQPRSPQVVVRRMVSSPRHLTTPLLSVPRQFPSYPVSPTASVGTPTSSEPAVATITTIPLRKCSACLSARPRDLFLNGEYTCVDCMRVLGVPDSPPAPVATSIAAEKRVLGATNSPPAPDITHIVAEEERVLSIPNNIPAPAVPKVAAEKESSPPSAPSAAAASVPPLNISSISAVKAPAKTSPMQAPEAPAPVQTLPARVEAPSAPLASGLPKSPIISALEAEQEAIQAEIDRGLDVLRVLLSKQASL